MQTKHIRVRRKSINNAKEKDHTHMCVCIIAIDFNRQCTNTLMCTFSFEIFSALNGTGFFLSPNAQMIVKCIIEICTFTLLTKKCRAYALCCKTQHTSEFYIIYASISYTQSALWVDDPLERRRDVWANGSRLGAGLPSKASLTLFAFYSYSSIIHMCELLGGGGGRESDDAASRS